MWPFFTQLISCAHYVASFLPSFLLSNCSNPKWHLAELFLASLMMSWPQSKFHHYNPWKHTTVDALQCVKTFPKQGWQIIILCRMDKKPLFNHKNSHRFLSPFRCINWEYFASFCNFVHLFFLKIRFRPWSDHYWVWCCCFWDHCLSLERHI